jgi:SAM-dependent methyltransferase
MTPATNLAHRLGERLGTPTIEHYLRDVVEQSGVELALDIGCGVTSLLTRFRPQLKTVGLDVFTIDAASRGNAHDHYISADITNIPVERVMEELQIRFGRPRADLVTLFGVIEHFPRRTGLEMLEKVERLSDRFVFIETPNGFVPQGPEYGNPYQRHLSGWFPQDFEAFGYCVHGSLGTKYLRGYMGEPRVRFPGARLFDNVVLARLLMTHRFPQHAFSIAAIKDLRGVPARYTSYDDPNRI